jgi:hypothetical protein
MLSYTVASWISWPRKVIVPSLPRSWWRMMASQTASACGVGAGWGDEERRLRAVMAPWNSKDRRVLVRKAGAVPMSWRRAVRARVVGERVAR